MKKFLNLLRFLILWVLLILGVLVILILITVAITGFVTTPSNDRVWNSDQAILPYAEINNNLVSIHNIRDFRYASTTSYTEHYYDKTYNLNDLTKVWYVVEPFSGIPGSAHTFLSFEFKNNSTTSVATSIFVSISVEIRKEQGESFNPILGMFNKYELMYVIADEQDVIKLRTNYRKDQVYLYPIKTEKARELFLSMINRTNTLKDHPEFYNSLINNCTTNIVKHVDAITPKRVPLFNLQILLPANSDKLAYDLGLLDTNLSFEQARKRYYINDKAEKYADDPDFSVKIREE